MGPRVRAFALTAHVVSSVGWLGAVVAFLALAVAGLAADDEATVRGAYVAMELLTSYVIVPLALASVVTGVVQGLGTTWGLLRYWWVVVKLVITVVATVVLLTEVGPIGYVARAAVDTALAPDDLRVERFSLAAHAAGGLLVLLVATVLSVYKPPGVTRFRRS